MTLSDWAAEAKKEFQRLLSASKENVIGLAKFVAEIRSRFGEGEYAAWLAFMKDAANWGESPAKKWARVGAWLMALDEKQIDSLPIEFSKLDTLRRIPLPHFARFRQRYKAAFGPDSVDRDVIREWVNEYLVANGIQEKPEEEEAQVEPPVYPEVQQLQLALHDPRVLVSTVDCTKEMLLSNVYALRSIQKAVHMKDRRFLEDTRRCYEKLLQELNKDIKRLA